jgi:rod shape-determining protein MreC
VAVLAAITLITIDSRGNGTGALGSVRHGVSDVFSPVQRATHTALAPVGNFLTGAADYGSLRSENERLRNQIAAMQAGTVASAAAQAQAQAVLAQEHLPYFGSSPRVICQVIDAGASNFENTVTVDKGSRDGLAIGQPVVAPGGLVGDVLSVTAHTAIVDLLTDPNFVVGVRLADGVVGSAQGYGRASPLRVTFDSPPPAGFHMTKGQAVTTSGEDLDKFPSGIPVASVASFADPIGATTPTVTLTPNVALAKLGYLSVEIWSPQ